MTYNSSKWHKITYLYNYKRKILRKILDPIYYNKEIIRLKSKVRNAYNRRKLGAHYLEEMKQPSKQLLATKKSVQQAFLKSILSKEGNAGLSYTNK